ncbi:MAG TPA: glycosyltransferase family 2 protein [Candidatus Binatus sp.]|nr:glycosyltransferase family 2 protein [Candidatus Binatus sp.]
MRKSTESPMLVSIVINNYNYARYLPECLDSALHQTYRPVEVVVVDDGSTDDSQDLILSYGNRVKAIFKNNGGQGSAINAGFAASSGAIVIFLDADDILSLDAVERVVAQWNPCVARVQHRLKCVNERGHALGTTVGPNDGLRRLGAAGVMLGPFAIATPTSGNAFSRRALERILPMPEADWKICADAYLATMSSLFGEVISIEAVLGKYRQHHGNNFSGGEDIETLRMMLSVDFRAHKELSRFLGESMSDIETWLSRQPRHWVGRIASLRARKGNHPWDDTLPELVRKAMRATWNQPYWNRRQKAFFAAWVLTSAYTPRPFVGATETSRSLLRAGRFVLGSM